MTHASFPQRQESYDLWDEKQCPSCFRKYPYRITQSKYCLFCIATSRQLSDLVSQEIKVDKCPECLVILDEKGQRVRESGELDPTVEVCFNRLPSLRLIGDINSAILQTGPDSHLAQLTCGVRPSVSSIQLGGSPNTDEPEKHSKRIKNSINFVDSTHHLNSQSSVKIAVKYRSLLCQSCKVQSCSSKFRAVVRIKHENPHRKALLMLEQMILKNGCDRNMAKAVRKGNQITCYFNNKRQAEEFIAFVDNVALIQSKEHFEVVTESAKGNNNQKQAIYEVEILRPAKDDIIVIPEAMQTYLNLSSKLLVCQKMFTDIQVIELATFKSIQIPVRTFLKYQKEIKVVSSIEDRTEFEVINLTRNEDPSFWQNSVGPVPSPRLWKVNLKRCSDGELMESLTQMGHALAVGDRVAGYDLRSISLQKPSLGFTLQTGAQKVFLFRKLYPGTERVWRLKSLFVSENKDEFGFDLLDDLALKDSHEERCFDDFCDELDNNKHIRRKVNLYRV